MTETIPQANRNALSGNNAGNEISNNAQRIVEGDGGSGSESEGSPRRGSANNNMNHAESLLDSLLEAMQKFWIQVCRIFTYIMMELGCYELFDAMVIWCVRNPSWAICLISAGLVLLMPFLIISGFGITTMIMTLTGILILEGTLVTIISIYFLACLSSLVLVIVALVLIGMAITFVFAHIYDFYSGMERHRLTLLDYIQKQREELRPARLSRSSSARRRVLAQPRE